MLLWVFVTINVQELMETGEGIRFLGIRQFLGTMLVLEAEFSSTAASTINHQAMSLDPENYFLINLFLSLKIIFKEKESANFHE